MASLDDIIQREVDPSHLSRATLENILIVHYANQLNDYEFTELAPQVKRLVEKRRNEIHDKKEKESRHQSQLEQERLHQSQLKELEEKHQKQIKKMKEEKEDGVLLCTICFDNKMDCLLLDCRHLASCMKCAQKTTNNQCPICRQQVTTFLRVYSS
ncbi:hypothetical protein BDC45DRAFT_504908 [Circinella umbellata]|nr:hypothetical protein BDC45DRAFT_504908 [Circinella umbellata]